MASITSLLNRVNTSDYSYSSVSNTSNMYTDTSSTTYSSMALKSGSNAESYRYIYFNTSQLPEGITINSVTAKIKCNMRVANSSYQNRITTATAQLFTGDSFTLKGSATNTLSWSTTTYNLTPGIWTYEELTTAGLKIYAKRSSTSSNTTSIYYDIYGAELIIDYTDENEQTLLVKIEGSWKQPTQVFKKVNGSWVEQINIANVFDSTKKYIPHKIVAAKLPSAYQEVSYIGVTDVGPYINTNLDAGNLEVNSIFQLTSLASGGTFGVSAGGAYNILSSQQFLPIVGVYTNNNFHWQDSQRNDVYSTTQDLNKHKIIYNNSLHQIIFDNNIVATNSNLPQTSLPETPMYLFGVNYSLNSTWLPNWRLYYCKFTDNDTGTILREFIPCYRKSDNVIGMYDLANGVFYTNSGSGSFIKGPDI